MFFTPFVGLQGQHRRFPRRILSQTKNTAIDNVLLARYCEVMGSVRVSNHSPGLVLPRLSGWLSVDRLSLLFGLFRSIHWWLSHQRREGMYEILDYDTTLELLDPKGKLATLKKRQRVRFLQNNVIAFQDYAWGDGQIFADYRCSPGVEVDRYQEGDRWNILISLRETKNSGDIVDFYIERTVRSSFTKAEEWRQVEIRHKTKRLKISIVFPRERHCQRAVLLRRSQPGTTILGPEHFTKLPDGRQMLTWEAKRIGRFEIYTIRWRW
jgi:hypothetical protein